MRSDLIRCTRCGITREATRLPRGWKQHADEVWCDRCWRASYMLRAVVLPVAGPVDATWQEFRDALHACWSRSTRLANWATLELARADVTRTAEMEKLPAARKVYLYPGARELVPEMDTGSVVSLLHAVERRYRAARYDVVWRSARALPTYRYPTPYPVHNQRWSVALGEHGEPLVRVSLDGQRWTLQLRRKNRGRQLAALRRLVDGEAAQGELALYGRGGDVMCKLVLWLPRPQTAARPKSGTLHVRTAADSFLVYHVDDEEPRYLHADEIRRVCAAHRKRLARIGDDTKAEKRRPRSERRGIDRRRQEWARKYRNRMDSWTHEVTAMIAGYAVRRGVACVAYDDTARAYLPDAPYHQIRERLAYKLAAHGIELASGNAVSDSGEPFEGVA